MDDRVFHDRMQLSIEFSDANSVEFQTSSVDLFIIDNGLGMFIIQEIF